MTNDFMKDAPVGTIIFNKGTKQHYEKVTRNGRTYWKMKVGSRLYSLSINRNQDVLGKKGKDQQGRIIDVGDDIPDYIDQRGMIQIKDGKYIDSKGNVLDKHKIKKGQVYHIEGFDTDIGKNLVSDLAETNRFKKHQRTYSRYYDLERTIKPWLKKDPNDFAYGNSGETVGEVINRLKTEQSKLQKPEPFVSSQYTDTSKESIVKPEKSSFYFTNKYEKDNDVPPQVKKEIDKGKSELQELFGVKL
tara:strand:+ start:61 stop:798 length:738 start_codon:yes stop_codon:yes gene_type:complete